MSTVIPQAPVSAHQLPRPDRRRWRALAVLGLIQFMLVLDMTVVNVALPRIQHDLGFSRPGLAWVVNGYVLMAGGLLFAAAFFTYIFLLTLFEQQVLGYSPLTGGLSYLPFGAALGAGMGLGTALMPRAGAKPVLSAAFFGAAAGLLLTSAIHPGTSYLGGILPGMIVLGVFCGMSFPAILNAALHQVTGQDSSLASGVQTATQQAGGALGLACLVTLALRHAAAQARHGVPPPWPPPTATPSHCG
jgi:predicted MFS family arabinose efflux permease